jgi:squalene synthase HpnC
MVSRNGLVYRTRAFDATRAVASLEHDKQRNVPVDHYENFPVASWLVPGRLRPAIVAIYNFARAADDIADEGDDTPASRVAKLDQYEHQLDRIERGETPDAPMFRALADAIRRHALPLGLLRDLLSAFRQDVNKNRYADFAEILDYCTRSANPIGRLLLHLYGVHGDMHLRRSDAICSGLQLVNFWQDIAVDWRKGRVYLPLEDMRQFGISEEDIAAGRNDDAWTRMLAFECARAREMLEDGRPLAHALPLRAGMELKLVVAGGLRILRAIDGVGGDVFRHRPILARGDWGAMLWSAFAR